MSELLKLKFEPLNDGIDSIDTIDNLGKYKIDVEYLNKHIVGSKLDIRDEDGLGAILLFTRDFIEVDLHYMDSWGDERFPANKVLNNGCYIKQEELQLYIQNIKLSKEKLKELCLKKQKLEDYDKNLEKEWVEQQPFEVTL
nr:MAG TPA: hypothetical protein [Caudoviricetes sp.]